MNHHLVIILPALNEAKTIGEVLSRIPAAIDGIDAITPIVINDGSTDATEVIARQSGARVISHPKSLGVGAAFHSGMREALEAGADIIVNIDADGQFNPEDIPILITPILERRAEFVTASRFAKKELIPDMPAIKKWGNKWVTRLVNFITRKRFNDVSCGFRAYSREAALQLTLFGHFTYTQETFIDLAFKDISMLEIPLKVRGERRHGNSRVYSNPFHYATKSFSIMFRAARDYKPFYFIGVPGVIIFLAGLASGIFVLVHYLRTGQTFPYRSLVFVTGTALIIGFLLLFISMLADMTHRNRVLIEELLYMSRKNMYRKKDEQA